MSRTLPEPSSTSASADDPDRRLANYGLCLLSLLSTAITRAAHKCFIKPQYSESNANTITWACSASCNRNSDGVSSDSTRRAVASGHVIWSASDHNCCFIAVAAANSRSGQGSGLCSRPAIRRSMSFCPADGTVPTALRGYCVSLAVPAIPMAVQDNCTSHIWLFVTSTRARKAMLHKCLRRQILSARNPLHPSAPASSLLSRLAQRGRTCQQLFHPHLSSGAMPPMSPKTLTI